MSRRVLGLLFIGVWCCCLCGADSGDRSAKLVEVKKIWAQGDYNSFTDLVFFEDKLYCAFREAKKHGVSTDGSIRILVSSDSNTWKPIALISSKKGDLRDPHLTVTPENKLMLSVCIAANPHPKLISASYFSADGVNWSQANTFGKLNSWMWRVTWKDDVAYGFSYRCKEPFFIQLFTSADGKNFSKLGKPCFQGIYNNETSTILFQQDGTALCLLRCSGPAHLGQSKPPYDEWTWKKLNMQVGGPEMIKLPDGRIVACGRLYDSPVRTSLCWVDPEAATLTEFLTLPSGGDTSYPGLLWHDNKLLVSYYSSHEGAKARIYLAKVKFGKAAVPPYSQKAKKSDVKSWKLATSAGKIDKLTQQNLYDLSELGFKCIEVGLPYAQTDQDFENVNKYATQLKQFADNASIDIWSVHIPYGNAYDPSTVDLAARQQVIERVDKMLMAVEPLEISKAVFHQSFEPVRPDERHARLKACKEALPVIVANAAKDGVQITIESLPRTCLGNTSQEILHIAEGIDGIGICCDTNHMLQETTLHFIRKVGPMITTVHIADYDAKDERHWLPGKGVIDWNQVIAALSETGYDGPFMFECKGTKHEKEETFKKLKSDYFSSIK